MRSAAVTLRSPSSWPHGWVLVLLAVLACGGGGEVDVQVVGEVEVPDGGTIRGAVRFVGDPSQVEPLEISKDTEVCGTSHPSPRLVVGKNNGVQNAIVYLEGVTGAKRPDGGPKVTVDQRRCVYVPHMMVVPVGTQLEIVNSDPILHNVHARDTQDDLRTVFNIAQPIPGQRTAIEQTRLTKAGLLVLSCEAGHPWMSAFIFVAEHPYVAVTGVDGEFLLEDVPPGPYRITMWHEGVILTRVLKELQRYDFEEPYKVTKEVEVLPSGEAVVDFELALRGP